MSDQAKQQALKTIEQLTEEFAEEYGQPIVTADLRIFLPPKKTLVDGKVVLKAILIGKIDLASGKLDPSEAFRALAESRPNPNRKLTQRGDQLVWVTQEKAPGGGVTERVEPLTKEEQQAAAEQQAAQQQQSWNENSVDWMRKLGTISGIARTTAYTGSFLDGLGRGPDPYGRRGFGTSWYTGLQVAQILDGQAGGKLLPQWTKTGPVGIALEWGLQAYSMLDMGHDLKTLGSAFPRTAAAMNTFTSPTRAVLRGVASLAQKARGPVPAPVPVHSPETAGVLKTLGQGIFSDKPTIQVVGAGNLAGQAAIVTPEGVRMLPRSAIGEAVKMVSPPVVGGARVQAGVRDAIHGALASFRPAIMPLIIGATVLSTVSAGINVNHTIKNQGPKALVTTKNGRGSTMNLISSAAILTSYLLPATPQMAVARAGLNVASHLLAGSSMVNYAGIFGGGGYLDHDAVRAAFLVPPLSPLGLVAFALKGREKKHARERVAAELAQKQAAEQLAQAQKQASQQLQAAGSIDGVAPQKDGSIVLQTNVSADALAGPAKPRDADLPDDLSRSMRMQTMRPMR